MSLLCLGSAIGTFHLQFTVAIHHMHCFFFVTNKDTAFLLNVPLTLSATRVHNSHMVSIATHHLDRI